MNRKILALLVALCMVAALTACGGNKDNKTGQNNPAPQTTTTTKAAPEGGDDSGNNVSDPAPSGDEAAKAGLKERFTIGYYGGDVNDTEFYWAVAPDLKSGMLLIISADQSQKMLFLGSISGVEGEEEWLNLTDDNSGNEMKVKVEKVDPNDADKGIRFTNEAGDEAVLLVMPADRIIDKIFELMAE